MMSCLSVYIFILITIVNMSTIIVFTRIINNMLFIVNILSFIFF